jgi:hypothetical protein
MNEQKLAQYVELEYPRLIRTRVVLIPRLWALFVTFSDYSTWEISGAEEMKTFIRETLLLTEGLITEGPATRPND